MRSFLSSLEDEQEQRDNLEQGGDHKSQERGRLGRSRETAETKGELSREDAHDILRARKYPHEDGPL